MEKYKNGLVFSGGGIRGFAHLGFAHALKEKGVEIDIYAGASAGALVAAFLADGYSPKEAFESFKKLGLFGYTKVHWPKNGLLTLDGLKDLLDKHISVDLIEDLKKPVVVAVSNLNSGKVEYRSEGLISEWVVASSSIPVLFSPKEIDGDFYADGGLLDNLPASAIQGTCRTVIGVNVSPLHEEASIDNLLKMAVRTFQISVDVTARAGKTMCDIYIEPKGIGDIYLLDTKSADKCFQIGYEAASQLKEEDLERLV